MRGLVHGIYLKYFGAGDLLLELNAGTGEDAVFLASKGISVFLTDISDRMLEIAEKKITAFKLNTLLKTGAFSFSEISGVPESSFDGIISNFGGLNCINNFHKLSADLSDKLKPEKLFIAVVMNKFCPWEIFYYLLKFDRKNALRRFRKEGIYANINSEKVLTFYFSPSGFKKQFQDYFEVVRVYSLGLFTPPPYLAGLYRYLKPIVKLFMLTDKILMGCFPFNRLGDHFVIVFKKKNQ